MVSPMKRTAATGTLLALALVTAPASPAASAVPDGPLATASSPQRGGEHAVLPHVDVLTAGHHARAHTLPSPATLAGADKAPAASLISSVAADAEGAAAQAGPAPRSRGPPSS